MIIKSILILSVVALAGCARTHQYNAVPDTPSHTNIALAEAASSVSRSLVQLAQIEQAAHPLAQVAPMPNPNSFGMGQTASVDWSGPIGALVAQLAKATDYDVRVLGDEPAIPVLVTLNEQNVSIAQILRDAAFQCGKRADVLVFPQTHVIEIRYETE